MKQIVRSAFIFMVLIFCLCLTRENLIAQGSNEIGGSSSTKGERQEPSFVDGPREALSEAARIISLQETINSEKESLAKLEKELEDRQTTFDEVSDSLKNLSSQKNQKIVD